MKKVLLISDNITSRLNYVCDFIFNHYYKVPWELTDKIDPASDYFIVNYSEKFLKNAFNIKPLGLLAEKGIKLIYPPADRSGDTVIFFPVKVGNTDFDILSAIFYLLSRYEEYLPSERDKYDRFKAENSILYRYNVLHIPLVNVWLNLLAKQLTGFYPGIILKNPSPGFLPTIDIDNPWLYLYKPLFRKAGGIIKDAMMFRLTSLKRRFRVLSGREEDPFDTYLEIMNAGPEEIIFFFLLGNRHKYDNKISSKKPVWKNLVRNIAEKYSFGIHPSYRSYTDAGLIKKEIKILQQLTGKKTEKSRQHFLRLKLPETYQSLLESGIKEDYSLGYAELPGFRAGTNIPFYFYDLESEKQTDLKVFPLTVMDRTLKDYLKLEPSDAKNKIADLVRETRKYGGLFISVWHNESFDTMEEWYGWSEVFSYILKEAGKLNK